MTPTERSEHYRNVLAVLGGIGLLAGLAMIWISAQDNPFMAEPADPAYSILGVAGRVVGVAGGLCLVAYLAVGVLRR